MHDGMVAVFAEFCSSCSPSCAAFNQITAGIILSSSLQRNTNKHRNKNNNSSNSNNTNNTANSARGPSSRSFFFVLLRSRPSQQSGAFSAQAAERESAAAAAASSSTYFCSWCGIRWCHWHSCAAAGEGPFLSTPPAEL